MFVIEMNTEQDEDHIRVLWALICFFVKNFDPVLRSEQNSRAEIAEAKRKSYVFTQKIFSRYFSMLCIHPLKTMRS